MLGKTKLDLKKEFRVINKLCFGGKLKMPKLKLHKHIWFKDGIQHEGYVSGAIKIHGYWSEAKNRIGISSHSHSGHLLEVRYTLLHEMQHYKDVLDNNKRIHKNPHDRAFKKIIKRLEAKIRKFYIKAEWADYRKFAKSAKITMAKLKKAGKNKEARWFKKKCDNYRGALTKYERIYG